MSSRTFGKKQWDRKECLTAFLFLFPAFAVFTVFKYYPLLDNFRISLTNWNLFSEKMKFVGFENYARIFASSDFWKILWNTVFYTVASTMISIVLGFFAAKCLFGQKGKWPKVFSTLFFIPNITTASAVAILWIWLFDPDFGLSGQLFNLFGMASPRWLLTPEYSMWVVISLSVWRSIGYVMLIYTSGMTAISNDVYEAASIDGASKFQQTMKITVPLLKPTTYFLMLTMMIQAMQVFDIVSVMTGGGPYNSTNVMNLYIYQQAFQRNRAGYASALSVVLFLILLSLTVVKQAASKNKED